MASATDIVTYIGVPLAVLGVSPIFYTSIKAFSLYWKIRAAFKQNHIQEVEIHPRLLNGEIELRMQRKMIKPLGRLEPGYFDVSSKISKLRGGSWTSLQWRETPLEVQTYTLSKIIDLRQPPADISFEKLVWFLMDRGAVPCEKGVSKLVNAGLWAPAGTTHVLVLQNTHNPILSVAQPYDTHGTLCLKLGCIPELDRTRNIDSLPPGWIQLHCPDCPSIELSIGTSGVQECRRKVLIESESSGKEQFASNNKTSESSQSSIVYEKVDISHLNIGSSNSNNVRTWFACTATAIASTDGLWGFACPRNMIDFANSASVPSGVLVYLNYIRASEALPWEPAKPDDNEEWQRHFQQQCLARTRAEAEGRRLPLDQQPAFRDRQRRKEMDEANDRRKRRYFQEQDYAKQRPLAALQSSLLTIEKVAEKIVKWLEGKQYVLGNVKIEQITEKIVYEMITDVEKAKSISVMLEKWMAWTKNGAMLKPDLDFVEEERHMDFALACCILSVIKTSRSSVTSQVVLDLQECFRTFPTIHLG